MTPRVRTRKRPRNIGLTPARDLDTRTLSQCVTEIEARTGEQVTPLLKVSKYQLQHKERVPTAAQSSMSKSRVYWSHWRSEKTRAEQPDSSVTCL
jgi:hypothetical protein